MHEYTEAMDEISGFGGDYEAACRAMVKAGCEWWDAHPDAKPEFHSYKNIYGIIVEENQDAKDLSEATIAPVRDFGPTGAMHQAAIGHILFIHKNGWEKYVEEMAMRPKADAVPTNG